MRLSELADALEALEKTRSRSRMAEHVADHTCGKSGRSPGYALRFPRMLSVRTDKSATDATTEREIVSMYKQQRK